MPPYNSSEGIASILIHIYPYKCQNIYRLWFVKHRGTVFSGSYELQVTSYKLAAVALSLDDRSAGLDRSLVSSKTKTLEYPVAIHYPFSF